MASTVARATPRAVPRHPAWASPIACCTGDRKSTRLNSSHSQISYAVFCLKKKKIIREVQPLHGTSLPADSLIHLDYPTGPELNTTCRSKSSPCTRHHADDPSHRHQLPMSR